MSESNMSIGEETQLLIVDDLVTISKTILLPQLKLS